jgi:hypothetical protein
MTIITDDWDDLNTCTNGMIFEFNDMAPAKVFAIAVKERFGLDNRVFANSEDAERAHVFPFKQNAPVVHVDRPYWTLPNDSTDAEWDAAFAKEREIEALAKEFGGTFVGT